MTAEELFVLMIMLMSALAALVIYIRVKISRSKNVRVSTLRSGWLLFSLSALLMCGYEFLRYETSDRKTALVTIFLSLLLSLVGFYKSLFPIRKKQVDDSRQLEHYRDEYLNRKSTRN